LLHVRSVSREEAWTVPGVQGAWVGVGVKPIRACLCLWSRFAASKAKPDLLPDTAGTAHTSSLDTDLTRNTRAPHFTP